MNDLLQRQRKFKLALLMFIVSTALVIADKLSGGEWVTMNVFIMGLYGASNVGAAWAGKSG